MGAHPTLATEEARGMRLRIGVLRQRVKANLPIEFVPQRLTSYGGLELIRRYFRRLDLRRRADQVLAAAGVRSDYGSGRVLLLVLALLVVGARRLEHLQYIGGDPLVGRLCGLRRLPTARTVANWLKQFTQRGVQALRMLNRDLLGAHLRRLRLARLTIDVDGTVISTGSQVAWAFRGFNPHQRKKPSYYPLLAHLAQTGQILDLRNRPGNVHDSRGAARFLSALITDLRQRLGRAVPLEFRMDAAFFQQEVLRLLQRRGCEYAIKVGFWKWVGLKARVAAQREWTRLTDVLSAFEATVPCTPWGLTLRVLTYRRRFQLDTLATPKPRCRKRTYAYVLRSMRTLRFLLVVRAGRLSRIGNRQVLRLPQNPATETLYERVVHALAA